MKKIIVGFICAFLFLNSVVLYAEERKDDFNQIVLIEDDKTGTQASPVRSEVTYIGNMKTYASYEDFLKEIGSKEKENDPTIEFYIRTVLETGEQFIFSNRDDEKAIERLNRISEMSQAIEICNSSNALMSVSPNNQAAFPCSTVCQIRVTFKNTSGTLTGFSWGTGFFVGPKQIATSAHMLKIIRSGIMNTADSIEVYYSYKDSVSGARRFGVTSGTTWSINAGFNVAGSVSSTLGTDFGLIELSSNIGNSCQYCKLNPENIDTSLQYGIMGFPGYGSTIKSNTDTTPNTMEKYSGTIQNVNSSSFTFNMSFAEGMSGSPVFRQVGNKVEVFGIGKGVVGANNYATRISWDAFDFYNRQVRFRNLSLYQVSASIKSSGVQQFQQYINNNLPIQYLGSYLTIDGGFGPATRTAAVKLLQYWLNRTYNAGLDVDGRFGPATTAAIHSVTQGQSGMGVYILQGLLYGNGYDPKGFDGSFGVSGGQGCLNAVKYFQSDESLDVDGRAGPATFYALCV